VNWQEIEGNWKQIKGKARKEWGKLTDDDLDRIEGKREELVGALQKRYGKSREAVDREVGQWFDSLAETESRKN
jgi:uncharacterized protein YjbJ (UPF0337 family)